MLQFTKTYNCGTLACNTYRTVNGQTVYTVKDQLVQQPEGVTLQKYPPTRLLMILVEEVVYNQNLNDAQLASLSVFSYSRWRPRWRLCIKTCVFLHVYGRFYIVIHVFGCFRSQLIHLDMFQSNQSPFSASQVRH